MRAESWVETGGSPSRIAQLRECDVARETIHVMAEWSQAEAVEGLRAGAKPVQACDASVVREEFGGKGAWLVGLRLL